MMKGFLLLLIHLVTVLAQLAGPGGVRGLVAENLLMKQQLLVLSRTRRWAPNLTSVERFVLALCTLLVRPGRRPKVAAAVDGKSVRAFNRLARVYMLSSPSSRRSLARLVIGRARGRIVERVLLVTHQILIELGKRQLTL